MEYFILTILVGLMSPLQTAVNARLRSIVGDATVAAFISFAISTVLLTALLVASGEYMSMTAEAVNSVPWWGWMGGVCGMLFVATILPLFRAIGSVQSIVLPIFGQVVSSAVIDSYGWMGMPQHPATATRLVGMVLVMAGVVMVVVIPSMRMPSEARSKGAAAWQTYGIVLGIVMTMNTVANGRLGIELGSALTAATVSFVIGTALLASLCLMRGTMRQSARLMSRGNPWWIPMGGVFGAILIGGFTYLIPIVGVGALAVLSLFGQMAVSVLIDRYGLFGAERKPVGWVQMAGIATMLLGVALINVA